MKSLFLSVLMTVIAASAQAAVHEGKASSGARCSVRMELDKDLIGFAGEGVAFGFMVSQETISEALKKGQRSVTVTGNDGPIKARLALNFSDAGVLESAAFSQKSFRSTKKVKCGDLYGGTLAKVSTR